MESISPAGMRVHACPCFPAPRSIEDGDARPPGDVAAAALKVMRSRRHYECRVSPSNWLLAAGQSLAPKQTRFEPDSIYI
ncbi:unnamed protein product [Mesocestoides corti]|uniref:Uncharacterized protein n=1 Tax=Mesocestoides corti TaxID=53468 RepID=A0A0R3UL15_MESCO|nr:unnamed protein product [Mesocestoides corti]